MPVRPAIIGLLLGVATAATPALARPTIEWDRNTLTWATDGGYARLVRLHDGGLLLSYESRGRSFVKRSNDNARTWGDAVPAAAFEFGSASNPQPLVLADGTVWLFYNERPRDGRHPFTIRLTVSHDNGRTWTPRPEPLYVAGTKFEDGCWEPCAVQRASGEVQLFFANEGPYRTSSEQEITRIITTDNGRTWGRPEAVSFRPGHRDGMPVPIDLGAGRGIAVAIEDNGLAEDNEMKPTIVDLADADAKADAKPLPVEADDPRRWGALDRSLPTGVYAGAPFLVRTKNATILSCQSDEAGKPSRMAVYVGDENARRFGSVSWPFPTDAGESGMWNSLFASGDDKVVAVSGTTIGGRRGVWLIEGSVK